MSTDLEQWTQEEFLVYLMLYAANADGNITAKEQKIICEKVSQTIYEKVLEQFEKHNDSVCLENILKYKKEHFNAQDDVKEIVRKMEDVFMEDAKISNAERHILYLIEKLLKG